jgi:hypothetical protein
MKNVFDQTSENLAWRELGLRPDHEKLLKSSAISAAVAKERGYASCTSSQWLEELDFGPGQQKSPTLLIPIHNVHGEVAHHQSRPDEPRWKDDKPVKYETPKGARQVLDVPPRVRELIRDPSIPLFITEGARKADAAVSAGMCCISMNGVWGMGGTNEYGGKTVLIDWKSIALNGRDVHIVFDSDSATNPMVQKALTQTRALLESRDAVVRVVYLPSTGNGKVGLDDFFAAGGTVEELLGVSLDTSKRQVSSRNRPTQTEKGTSDTSDTSFAIPEEPDPGDKSPTARLIGLMLEQFAERSGEVGAFHTSGGKVYVVLPAGGHLETHAIRSSGFRLWLTKLYYDTTSKAVKKTALDEVIDLMEAVGRFDGPQAEVHLRVAEHEGDIYIDLCDDRWRAVRVHGVRAELRHPDGQVAEGRPLPDGSGLEYDSDVEPVLLEDEGWEIIDNPPVRFTRGENNWPLPEPIRGGSINDLRRLVNVTDDDWILLLGWLAQAYNPRGSYPPLAVHGEYGSAKTSTCNIVRSLVDPNSVLLNSPPEKRNDIMATAQESWVIGFDNMSSIEVWMSDELCRIATGAGQSGRKLYTDADVAAFKAKRPVLLNGINEIADRGDLLDRMIILDLPVIPEEERRQEEELLAEFLQVRAGILGAILDGLAAGLTKKEMIRPKQLPRMADAAVWATAVEGTWGIPMGSFLERIAENRAAARVLLMEWNPIAPHIISLASSIGFHDSEAGFEGSATEVLKELNLLEKDAAVKKLKSWPQSADALGGMLRQLAPDLRQIGVECHRSKSGNRSWQIFKTRS